MFIDASNKDVLLILNSCHWLVRRAEESETIFNGSRAEGLTAPYTFKSIKIKIILNFCFHTALLCFKGFYEGL